MAWVTFQVFEVLEVTGVGEQVEVHHRFVGLVEPVEDEVGTDEAGSAGNEDQRNTPRQSFTNFFNMLEVRIALILNNFS